MALALADERGGLRARRRRPTEPTGRPEDDVARIALEARALLRDEGLSASDVAAVGISVPGPVDLARGLVVSPPNLPGWEEVAVRPRLEEALGVRAFLDNDANAAALAEFRFGAAKPFDHAIYLTMSTGVGGGLVLDGRVHRGHGWNAGEIGHTPVEWEGEPCACGLRGCLEAYVGGASWQQRLRRVTPETSEAAKRAGGREQVKPEHLVEAARAGDAFARGEMERFNGYLARALTALVFTLAPQVIVLGTICVAAGEELCFRPLRESVRGHVWPVFAEGLEIVPAKLGGDLAYYAGVCVALDGLETGG